MAKCTKCNGEGKVANSAELDAVRERVRALETALREVIEPWKRPYDIIITECTALLAQAVESEAKT